MRIHLAILPNISSELDDLLEEYFASTDAKKGIPPLDMDWDLYCRLWEMQRLMVLTAEDELIQGFVMYHVNPHPHHKSILAGICDILAVRPPMRGKGLGRLLIEHAIPLLKEEGVGMMIHSYRTVYTAKPLFPDLGFELFEHNYIRMLK
jgi:GNAT superfamily N-acetyltransferase